jgi:mRNA-degrading endonuclease toxin of MazEF toxin-antitoxin module
MVVRYVPEAGDIAWLDFDPQAGRKKGAARLWC